MATLPTNLKDDILDASVNQRRRYNMITNPDGTVEFEDVTVYSQVGSEYGAGLINETNKQINGKVDDSKIVRDLKTIGAMTQEGFIPDALALKEVNESLATIGSYTLIADGVGNFTVDISPYKFLLIVCCNTSTGSMLGSGIYIRDTIQSGTAIYSMVAGTSDYCDCSFNTLSSITMKSSRNNIIPKLYGIK